MSKKSEPPKALPEGQSQDENQIIAERRAKVAELRRRGNPFPNDFRREHLAADLHKVWGDKPNEEIEPKHVAASVAGRVMLKRMMGKASFATIQDMSGRIQLYVTRDGIGEAAYEAFKHYDLGDIVGTKGTLFKTKTGELSVKVAELRLLVKSLRPLPEKFHGLADQEQKYRQRYVDLIMSEEARAVFQTRSRIVGAIREFMTAKGFLEVETPVRTRDRSRHTTTRSTWSFSCASRPSSTSSDWWWADSRRCSRSTATSGTRASRPGTTPSSRCSSSTKPTATTAISWTSRRSCCGKWRSRYSARCSCATASTPSTSPGPSSG
jgi:hypothetical protein